MANEKLKLKDVHPDMKRYIDEVGSIAYACDESKTDDYSPDDDCEADPKANGQYSNMGAITAVCKGHILAFMVLEGEIVDSAEYDATDANVKAFAKMLEEGVYAGIEVEEGGKRRTIEDFTDIFSAPLDDVVIGIKNKIPGG